MKILLVQPAGEWVRVRPGQPPLPRAMLRFSVMPLTIVGALTPSRHAVRLIDENVEALDCDEDVDLVAISFPVTPPGGRVFLTGGLELAY